MSDRAHEDVRETPLKLGARIQPRVSFALHQNSVPFLLELTLENTLEEAVEDVSVTVVASPPFVQETTWRFDRLERGAIRSMQMEDLELKLNGGLLGRLTEAERGQVTITAGQGDGVLGRWEADVELLARGQWGGLDPLPELIAAFVQPNDPAVDRILRQAIELLRTQGLPAAVDGYQSGSRQRVWEWVQAIWGAVCALGVAYALPPASFEQTGQKVRSPSQLWDGRVGTCLDTTLLFAACLEQCHLRPLVVLLDGHAFVGCWLIEDGFSVAVVDDPASLRTRLQLGEMLVFETTLATHRPAPTFRTAVAHAEQALADGYRQPFVVAIDIARTRMQGILPLASATDLAFEAAQAVTEAAAPAFEEAPQWVDAPGIAPARSPDDARLTGRLLQWQGKLLDLTLRNRLLNLHFTKGVLALDAPDPGRMEDRLADGHPLRLVPRPPLMTGGDPRGAAAHEQRGQEEILRAYAKAALGRNEVTVDLPAEELTARLLSLFRAARTSLQENGANTLHLAMGFLVWRKEERGAQAFKAPLVLVPVQLSRSSVRAGFRLSLGDEEPRFNPTLLQMLEQDFRLSIPELREALPRDDAGIDVGAVWRIVAERVKEFRGWEVVADVVLSTFSFTKFLMWRDMVDRLDDLMRNRVVRHLVESPHEPYPHVTPFPDPHTLDARYPATTTYCPLPADASQLAAVMAAAAGQDFLLIGPPGTGKSQTITNLITHCLAEGKTVLFIAEKTAALEVVHRRLEAAGLGPFCLELHSNKTKKLDVLTQLGRARLAAAEVDVPEVSPPDGQARPPVPRPSEQGEARAWERAVAKVDALRRDLNGVVECLHAPHRNGLTIFEAIGRVLGAREVPEVALSWPQVDAHDVEERAGWMERAEGLGTYAAAARLEPRDPLTPLRQTQWSPAWQSSLIQGARRVMALRGDLESLTGKLCAAVGLPSSELDALGRQRLTELAELVTAVAQAGWAFVLQGNAPAAALRSGQALLRRRVEVVRALSLPYDLRAALRLDLDALGATLTEAVGVWWLRRALLRRRVHQALMACTQSRGPGTLDPAADLERLAEIRELDRRLAGLQRLQLETNGLWRGLETDPAAVATAVKLGAALQKLARRMTGHPPGKRHVFAPEAGETVALKALAAQADGVLSILHQWEAAIGELRQRMAAEDEAPGEDTPQAWAEVCQALLANVPRLQAWCSWQRQRQAAAADGLLPLVVALEEGRVAAGEAVRVFDVNYCRWWLPGAVEQEAALCAFVPVAHEARMAEFAAADRDWLECVGPHVCSRLTMRCKRTLDGIRRGSPESKALGLLRHELAKKKRHLPVRELLGQLRPLLPVLAPCVLMSPLSVAQYLSSDATPFDLVVFDEASQIPVWDAIGAIARGEQVVVVGDPKQLPPTNFFGRSEQEPSDDPSLDADLESILDDCRGGGLPELQLRWHYRSRHESLIAFSNERYYDGTLVTFPSPVTEDHAVVYHHVAQGVYEKGASRTNRPEAMAVVDFVLSRLRDPAFAASGQSIGVVTFNAQQQQLIEDLLEREMEQDESLEAFFADGQNESVFVKNLENVQGDERDVMCFSITYGPDENGALSMNFGPLNKEGGERRLNVAITRARRALHVFAALQPEQIDLSRTRAKGVADLKRFLQYAQRGAGTAAPCIPAQAVDSGGSCIQVVCHALRSRGWQVQIGVGVSRLRVDIGVVDPDLPGAFIAGILCDGPSDDVAATARDRDLLRPQVLEGLGWRIGRTWSMEWWLDPTGALERLHAFLTQALAMARDKRSSDGQGLAPATRP